MLSLAIKSSSALSIIICSLLVSQPAYSYTQQRNSVFPTVLDFDYQTRELPDIELLKEEPIEVSEETEEVTEVLPTFRQTYYSVEEGETSVGALYHYNSKEMKIIDNVIHFFDQDFGYIPVIAINIDEVLASGQNEKGIWNVYGSIVELGYPNGTFSKAIILDACGECSRASKVDLWVYKNEPRLDVDNVTLRYIRKGWTDYLMTKEE